MTNEWAEFRAYTGTPQYSAKNKYDLSYLGRFTFKTITDHEGLGRILTILARGFLFHDETGKIRDGDPYTRIDYAKKALCAWCSTPSENKEPPYINFGDFSAEFPKLVTEKGEGWYYRHIKNILNFAQKNSDLISQKSKDTLAGISKGYLREWKKKVRQLQVPIFALNTKAAWALRFDDILGDALELGPLRCEKFILPPEKEKVLQNIDLSGMPSEVVRDVVAFCMANKPEETDWVVLPVANFDCYYGNTNFSKKWIGKIPQTILTREFSNGICRVKLNI